MNYFDQLFLTINYSFQTRSGFITRRDFSCTDLLRPVQERGETEKTQCCTPSPTQVEENFIGPMGNPIGKLFGGTMSEQIQKRGFAILIGVCIITPLFAMETWEGKIAGAALFLVVGMLFWGILFGKNEGNGGMKVEIFSTLLLFALANWQNIHIPSWVWIPIAIIIVSIILMALPLLRKNTRWHAALPIIASATAMTNETKFFIAMGVLLIIGIIVMWLWPKRRQHEAGGDFDDYFDHLAQLLLTCARRN